MGDPIFETVNGIQLAHLKPFCKLDSSGFPTSHHGAKSGVGKTSKRLLQKDLFMRYAPGIFSLFDTMHYAPVDEWEKCAFGKFFHAFQSLKFNIIAILGRKRYL